MNIEDLLKNFSMWDEKEIVGSILSNRIGSSVVALNNGEKFDQLVNDLICWKNAKGGDVMDVCEIVKTKQINRGNKE